MALLAQLKAQTADCHTALEDSMDVFRRVRTVEDYREVVRKFYTLYEPMEAKLSRAADWTAAGWDFEGRRKTSWLRDDLQALGVSAAELAGWQRAPEPGVAEDFGAAVGCLYVIEGSTLGGQVIAKQLLEPLGITTERGGKFFRAYGAETGRRWREFAQWAEQQAAQTPLEAAAVRGARQTFEEFARWMNR